MPIKEIGLTSFRNHDEIKMTFSPNINVIWGKNGSGKTAILEAIHTLSIGRSFRTNRKDDLLKDGKDFFSINGVFQNAKKELHIQINQTSNGTRRILVDNNRLENVRQLIGLNPVVLLSPEEQIITKGSPQDQRNYFNKLFSIVSGDYLNALSDYNRIIRQRNKLLTDFHTIVSAEAELVAWNEQIAESGMRLWSQWKKFYEQFTNRLKTILEKFDDPDIALSAEIHSDVAENKNTYLEKLGKLTKRDVYLGRTTYGPHKDKISFIFNGKNIKQFGSQGEHKLALLLIKLAEVQLIKEETNRDPIILLDDLFAKLDDVRSKQAIAMTGKNLQTIITTTDLKNVEERGIPVDEKNNSSFYLG